MRLVVVLSTTLLLSGCIITDDGLGFGSDGFDEPNTGDFRFDDESPIVGIDSRDDAFAAPVANLTREHQRDFLQGRALFELDWSPEDVGPVFNDISCAGCHQNDGRAHPDTKGLLFRLSGPDGNEEFTYGGQLQPQGVRRTPGEGEVIRRERLVSGDYPDGTLFTLGEPSYEFVNLNYGPLESGFLFSPRLAQQNIGLGLLEAIPEAEILALEDPEDVDGDGISGRANFVLDVEANAFRLGRFGWKSNQPSLRHQNAGAFHGDLGMTSSLFPDSPCTSQQDACNENDFSGRELRDDQLLRVTRYTQLLDAPQRRDADSAIVARGEALFEQVNCTGCHISEFVTGAHELPELENRRIQPFTDLLLHDMGEALADGRPDFDATGSEWRTPPLWGIGHLEEINGHTRLMHDGRANGVEEAILWHGGEASRSRAAFMVLDREDREAVVAFVESL